MYLEQCSRKINLYLHLLYFINKLKIILKLVSICVLFAFNLNAQTNDSKNMSLFDHVTVDSIGPHSALWGYTAPNGHEYAIFGGQRGTYIYDISEKPIKMCQYIWGPRSTWREMKVYKNYAYVGTESRDSGTGLQIIDLSNLPAKASLVRTDTSFFFSSHTLFIQGHLLYVMGTRAETQVNGGALILDLEPDPTHPVKVGDVKPYYYHDAYERGDTLYGCAIYGQGIDIYNVKDKLNPKLLTTITYPYSGPHNAEPTQDGKFLMSADEIGFTPKTLKIWSIGDLTNVSKVAEFTPNIDDIVHNVHSYGNYALVSWYTAGVRLIDMVDPYHPREVAYYDTYPGQSKNEYNGVWESFWFRKSNKIVSSDRQTGLWVMNLRLKSGGSFSGIVLNKIDDKPIANAEFEVMINGKKSNIKSDAQGKYYIGGVDDDSISFITTKLGYNKFVYNDLIKGNQVKNIPLNPEELYEVIIKAVDENNNPISDFQYSIEPIFGSTPSVGNEAKIKLQRFETYWVNVGKWGYNQGYKGINVVQNNQVLTVNLTHTYRDNFTLDLGWKTSDSIDNALTGQWTRLKPYLPFSQAQWAYPPNEASGNPGGYIYLTGNPPYNTPPAEVDVNKGSVVLTTPTMNLIEYEDPKLDLELWFVHYKKDTVRDSLRIQVSNDDGVKWVTMYKLATNDSAIGRGGWQHIELKLRDYIGVNNRMKVRIKTSDVLGTATMIVGIDNFYLQKNRTTELPIEIKSDKVNLSAFYSKEKNSIQVFVNSKNLNQDYRIEIYNVLGDRLAILHSGKLVNVVNNFEINNQLQSGSYFVTITTKEAIQSVPITVVK